MDLKTRSELVQCIQGNHEKIFLDYLDGTDLSTFFYNGGETTLDSYEKEGITHIPEEHIAFLKSLDSIIELDDYYIVHAGLRPGVEIHKQTLEDMLWIRDPFIFSDYNFGKKVIFGHTPFTSPLVMKNKIGLDTGAVFGNRLTCLELSSMEFHSVEA
jgi:serine/threonine protein phosphatase 1